MATKQIYSIVNNVVNQALGDDELSVYDAQGLIALGNTVLSSSTYTDAFLNVLVQRIGKTIISSRAYKSKFAGLMKDDYEWGNIVQKISFGIIQAQNDPSYGLVEGASVDHYKVNKPKVKQHLFTTETPYMFNVTIQREHLKEAFTSEAKMGAFIQGVYTSVQNSIEVSLENLGRACLGNMIAETYGTSRAFNLLDIYNTATNKSLTVASCKFDADFLRWCTGFIKKISERMTSMNEIYSNGDVPRHTPKALQKLFINTEYETQLETVVSYSAFNKEYVTLANFEEIPFWQSIETPEAIKVKKASNGTEVTINNVVGCLFDVEALGIYKEDVVVATTPVNAFGLYYNTAYHQREQYFNDLSEQFVLFYVAEV